MTPSLRRYAGLLTGSRTAVVGFLAASIVQFAAVAPIPFLVKRVFDRAIDDERAMLLAALVGSIMALQLLSTTAGYIAVRTALRLSSDTVARLRTQLFDKLYALSTRYLETHSLSGLHDRVVHETERVDNMVRNGFAPAIPGLIFALGLMAVLIVLNWRMFFVTVTFVPVVIAIHRLTRAALRRTSRRLHASIEDLSEVTFAGLRTMRQTRILGAEHLARDEQDGSIRGAADAAYRQGLTRRRHLAVNRTAASGWMIMVLLVGGIAVIDGRMTIGELFSFYAGLALLRQPLDQITSAIPVIVAGREALNRIFELLDVDEPRPYRGERRDDVEGHLVVENVTYGYSASHPVLCGVSMEVRPGEMVALVGPNGSGKTTLFNLVLAFDRPWSGQVRLDGVPYDEIDITHMRRQFGVLLQEPVMVRGTIRDNISYGRPGVGDAELAAALDLWGHAPILDEFESGLDTLAYENGALLSGGQLQRIALARALLGRPRVVILDEPSNHLYDEAIEALISALRELPERPALIVITHEPAVAQMADRVLGLQRGVLSPESG